MEQTQVPLLQLLVNAYDPKILILAVIPATLLIVVAVVITVVYRRRRLQEKTMWSEAEAAEKEPPSDVPSAVTAAPPASEVVQEPSIVEEIRSLDPAGWLKRLHAGLGKTREALSRALADMFTSGAMGEELLEKIHGALYRADIGGVTTDHLTDVLRKSPELRSEATWAKAQQVLKAEVTRILSAVEQPLTVVTPGAWVILVVGVNGAGKTTTIGKLAGFFAAQGKKVMLCAGDTFRAAAIEQLQVWGDRIGVPVIKQQQGSDPAAVAYDGVKAAMARGVDVLIIDTAGRLQNKEGLMAELTKIKRVIGKDLPGAPHETWLVLDATTGQNGVSQVQAFSEAATLTGLVVTKLDGTAKGGVVIGIANQFKLPIRFVGVGEKAADLRTFTAKDYADSLF